MDFNSDADKKGDSITNNPNIKYIDESVAKSNDFTDGYLIDKIFNDLMQSGYDNIAKQNTYLVQIAEKFWLLKLRSDKIFFEIHYQDLDKQTIQLLKEYTQDCKKPIEKYLKLNGIMTEVIAAIAKQSEHLIISRTIGTDLEWLKRSVNEVREYVSLKWKLMDGDVNSA